MMKSTLQRIPTDIVSFGLFVVLFLLGVFAYHWYPPINKPMLISAAAIGVAYVLLLAGSRRQRAKLEVCDTHESEPVGVPFILEDKVEEKFETPPLSAASSAVNPNDPEALVEQMLAQGRFALLLRPQIVNNLDKTLFSRALGALEKSMALVPDGEVILEEGEMSQVASVERFFLDRFPVTNRDFFEFVAADGYKQGALWDTGILPAVLDFVDSTGRPGPKYWHKGCFPKGEEKHPVVGISWYEAAAYARWVGKRLPCDAEWVKAGAWPVRISPTSRVQRKYPWGDSMDRSRANLWGSGVGRTVPVDQNVGGISIGGIYQLIGNVWEWTTCNYAGSSLPQEDIPRVGLQQSASLKSIRGGAFDTYFDNQAACQFQSGENPLHRRNNIGFRCAVGICELMLVQS
ncbi:MAG: formylglycine-generating enzyme family protein [Thermoguttaceae bacterium]